MSKITRDAAIGATVVEGAAVVVEVVLVEGIVVVVDVVVVAGAPVVVRGADVFAYAGRAAMFSVYMELVTLTTPITKGTPTHRRIRRLK